MNDGTTPLILAARLAVEGMVEELVHCHADINAVDDHGQYQNQYHHRPRITGSPCHSYQTCHQTLILMPMLRPVLSGKSALHWAAAVNNVEATLVLLKNGANRDMQDNKVGSADPKV